MNYLLYKEAEPDQAAVNRVAGAVGGGALGYLLTRYGLGIKGVGAGLTGAGMGATAGALGGDYLARYTEERKNQEDLDTKAVLKNKKLVAETMPETFRRNFYGPYKAATSAAIGGWHGYKADQRVKDHLSRRADSLATEFRAAAQAKKKGDPTLANKLTNKKFDSVLNQKVENILKGNRGNDKALVLLKEQATKNLKNKYYESQAGRRRFGVKGRHGLLVALISHLALTGGETMLEKKVFNDPRMNLIKNQGKE